MSASYLASDVERYYLRQIAQRDSRITELKEALQGFFEGIETFSGIPLEECDDDQFVMNVSIKKFKAARAALAKAEGK